MSGQDCEQLTLFPEDSPASRFPLPGSAEAKMMTVTSGRKCCALLKKSDPVGSLAKTLLESSVWRSTQCLLTWKISATPAGRLLFRLWPSTPRTGETDAPLLPTVTAFDATDGEKRGAVSGDPRNGLPGAVRLWPTPSASDGGRTKINPQVTQNGTIRHIGRNGKQSYARLDAVAALFPTPTARAGQNPCTHGDGEPDLATKIGGALNPDWVEWLMGFPIGWIEV